MALMLLSRKQTPTPSEYLKDRITEMEASQKKVAEALNRLRGQMNEIAKRIESGYQQAMSSGQPSTEDQE